MSRYPPFVRLLPAVAIIVAGAFYKVAVTPKRDWVRVARDAHYDIALDRASVTPVKVALRGKWEKGVDVWYRTDHAAPRDHKGKTFDREVVHAIVECERMRFRVLSVDMSTGGGKSVARLRASDDNDAWRQDWRNVERGTTEEIAAAAACHFGRRAGNQVAAAERK